MLSGARPAFFKALESASAASAGAWDWKERFKFSASCRKTGARSAAVNCRAAIPELPLQRIFSNKESERVLRPPMLGWDWRACQVFAWVKECGGLEVASEVRYIEDRC